VAGFRVYPHEVEALISGVPGVEDVAVIGVPDDTTGNAVVAYLEVAGLDAIPPVVACIGPVTAATARTAGLDVTLEAEVHTVEGLVEALLRWFAA
jgi:long-chain acyl-CoA synthetase